MSDRGPRNVKTEVNVDRVARALADRSVRIDDILSRFHISFHTAKKIMEERGIDRGPLSKRSGGYTR